MNSFPSVATPLDDLVVVGVSGPDATTFLQGQFTQDVSGKNACLAGYCSPKGRLMASMIVWHDADTATPVFHILVKQSIAQAFVQRLTKFIMRAKVTVNILQTRVFGATITTPCSELPASALPYDIQRTEHGTWVAAPVATQGTQRWWLIAPSLDTNDSAQTKAAWQEQDIAAGLGWVVAGIEELFIPQTLNMDITGGVSFGKGCYPGQEIVARSHYRGTIKRRMIYGTVAGDATATGGVTAATTTPGADVFDANNPDAPCGRVINAASTGTTHLLFEASIANLDSADFRLTSPEGPRIKLGNLPYSIKAD